MAVFPPDNISRSVLDGKRDPIKIPRNKIQFLRRKLVFPGYLQKFRNRIPGKIQIRDSFLIFRTCLHYSTPCKNGQGYTNQMNNPSYHSSFHLIVTLSVSNRWKRGTLVFYLFGESGQIDLSGQTISDWILAVPPCAVSESLSPWARKQ